MSERIPRVLSIAGTDPTGGAGLHADLKSISAAGGYAMGAVTAIVAQNTQGVIAIETPSTNILSAQLRAVSDDVAIDAVKIGMLGSIDTIATVRTWLRTHRPPIVVLDPVMVATSGDRLLEPEAEASLLDMLHEADAITPNIPELEVIAGTAAGSLDTDDAAIAAAQQVAARFHVTVVMKGGHLREATLTNAMVGADGVLATAHCPRVLTSCTHGTGCSMSSALATRLARGENAQEALEWTTRWLHESIEHGEALRVGQGHGPIDHLHRLRRLSSAASNHPWPSYVLSAQELLPEALETLLSPADPEAASIRHPATDRPDNAASASEPSQYERSADTCEAPTITVHDEDDGTPRDHMASPIGNRSDGIDAAGVIIAPGRTTGNRTWTDQALVPAAGPWTARLWQAARPILRDIQKLPFIRRLADGTLPIAQFTAYQFQDWQYLNQYARALAALASGTHDQQERNHWSTGAAGVSQVEQSLHRDWLSHHETNPADAVMSPITAGYTDFILARVFGEDYAIGTSAVLPCYWLYSHIGLQLAGHNADDHPYHRWLSTYGDPGFITSTTTAIAIVERQMESASMDTRTRVARAFLTACQWEREFFDQTDRD